MHVFSKKSQKFVTFLGKMQEISALEANIDSFQQVSVKYLPFPPWFNDKIFGPN